MRTPRSGTLHQALQIRTPRARGLRRACPNILRQCACQNRRSGCQTKIIASQEGQTMPAGRVFDRGRPVSGGRQCRRHRCRSTSSTPSASALKSKIELQCKLDLARVVVPIAQTVDLTEGCRVREIREGRVRELRRVRQIEELGTEFQMRPFGSAEILKERHVQAVESGTEELTGGAPQRSIVALPNGRGHWR